MLFPSIESSANRKVEGGNSGELGFVEDFEQQKGCLLEDNWVVVSNTCYFHTYLGKIPILTNIFQMG